MESYYDIKCQELSQLNQNVVTLLSYSQVCTLHREPSLDEAAIVNSRCSQQILVNGQPSGKGTHTCFRQIH